MQAQRASGHDASVVVVLAYNTRLQWNAAVWFRHNLRDRSTFRDFALRIHLQHRSRWGLGRRGDRRVIAAILGHDQNSVSFPLSRTRQWCRWGWWLRRSRCRRSGSSRSSTTTTLRHDALHQRITNGVSQHVAKLCLLDAGSRRTLRQMPAQGGQRLQHIFMLLTAGRQRWKCILQHIHCILDHH